MLMNGFISKGHDPINSHSINNKSWNILFCGNKKGLSQHEGEELMTEFSFFGELFLYNRESSFDTDLQ